MTIWFFFIGQRDHFGFSFTTLNKNVLKQPIRTAVSDVNDQLECESYARNPKRARENATGFAFDKLRM